MDGDGVGLEVLVGGIVLVRSGEVVDVGEGGGEIESTGKDWELETLAPAAGGFPEYSTKLSVESGTSDIDMKPR